MALRGLALAFLLVLAPLLLAWGQKDPGLKNQEGGKEAETCQQPQWDLRLRFTPKQRFYGLNEELTLSCFTEDPPPLAVIRCAKGASPHWKDAWEVKDIQGTWHGVAENLTCTTGTCPKPMWRTRVQFAPNKSSYEENEELTLTCPGELKPTFPQVKCAREFLQVSSGKPVYRYAWWGRSSTGAWMHIERAVGCTETCQRPWWDSRLRLAPDQESYKKNEEVTLSCPEGFQPPFTHIKCAGKGQPISHRQPVYTDTWWGKDSRGVWTHVPSNMECIEKCQKPQWDPRFIFDPDRVSYGFSEEVMMKCPEGYWSSAMEIKCVKLNPREGSTIPRSSWIVRNGTGHWHPMEGNMICVEVLQVVPGTLEISSTSIKLNWTCRLPDACQHIWARCRLEAHSSLPCEAEEVKGEEMLHGWKGIFTCPPLQPFTLYSVTISLPPSTILYTRLLRTKEAVPDKPEKLRLDPNTGSLQWKPLPSCKGEIIGYQLNITARRVNDGSFLEFKQVLVNQSVTRYMPPPQTPGRKYTVTVQGVTAAGAGAASLLEFQSYVSVAGQPPGSWPGSAVMVVVVLSLLVPLSAGMLWFVLSRKRKALPSKAEEDHYTELQPYENSDNYCMIKEAPLAEEDAGKDDLARELLPQPLPVLEASRRQSSKGEEKMGWRSKAEC